MTLNVNEPTDQRMISELPAYIREDRAAINAVSLSANSLGVTELEVAAGAVSLSIGTELGNFGHEIVEISGAGISTLLTILGGTNGQVKLFVFEDTNVRFTDSISKANGTFYLNHLPAGSNFEPQQDDILALVNIGGDGSTIQGYWKELYRTLSLR